MFRSRKSFLKSLLEPFTFCGLCANTRIKTSVAKNYDKRNEINRYRIPDLSEYTINIGFSHLIYKGTTNRIPSNYCAYNP